MKKVFIIFLSLFLVYLLVVEIIGDKFKWGEQEMIHTYLLSENFTGCAWIHYDQPGAGPLEINSNEVTEVIFKIPKNGVLHTSTPYETVANIHTTKVILMNEAGEPIKEVLDEFDLPPATGYSYDDQNPGDVSYINFASTEENCERF